jgi:hypothetical protein
MDNSNRPRWRWLRGRPRAALGHDQRGSQVIQIILAVPIVLGILWSSFEIWQIMSLKAAVRTTVAQAARYVTSFAELPDAIMDRPSTVEIRQNVERLVSESLSRQRGNLGDALTWELTWYQVVDPTDPRWEGNVVLLDALDPLAGLVCNDQFGLRLRVRVPWSTVILGLGGSSRSVSMLELEDTAVGGIPCFPYCEVKATARILSSGPGGCRIEVCWSFDCSYEPDRVEVWLDGVRVHQTNNPVGQPCVRLSESVPSGRTVQIRVDAYGGRRKSSATVAVGCP